MMQRISLFSIPIDALTMEQTLDVIEQAIDEKKQIHHTVVNAGKIVMMQDDRQLYESVINADLINADGQAVVWAARFLGKKIPERVAGIDIMQRLVARAHKRGYKAYFLGAEEEIVSAVVKLYAEKYSPSIIAGYRNGYFSADEEIGIAQEIASSGAQLLFVAITSPKKENFLYRHKSILQNVNFIMGVGGTFDVIAGKVKRAPKWMQRAGLEWFYRIIQEPGRMWKRYLVTNTMFIYYVISEWIESKKPLEDKRIRK